MAGAAAAVGAAVLGETSAATASADTVPAAGVIPVANFDVASGRWPVRPASTSVAWIDSSGSAPKPAMIVGDVYLRAGQGAPGASAVSGELLLPVMTKFGGPWNTRAGAAILPEGGATISAPGDALGLADVPVAAGSTVNYTVVCTSGEVIATIEFWDKEQSFGHFANTGSGTVTVSTKVPAGASVANLWIEYYKKPATLATASFAKAQ